MDDKNIFIGQLSKKAGVPVKTIRYYEDLGILKKPKRSFSEYRVYTQKDVDKLLFIKQAKELGLTLAEIKEILALSGDGLESTCCFVREVFNKKIKEYENKISELSDIKKKLEEKLKRWIEPREASLHKFTVCPQIESGSKGNKNKQKKRGEKNAY